MFVEMMLALFALVIAGTLYAAPSEYAAAISKGPGAILPPAWPNSWAPSASRPLWAVSYGSVMMIVLAITIMQLVIRFMRVATSELLSDISPVSAIPTWGPSSRVCSVSFSFSPVGGSTSGCSSAERTS